MTANEHLRDLQIRHAIHLLKFGNGLQRDVLTFLATLERDIVERIGARLALIQERGLDMGPATTARLNAMLDEVRTLTEGVYSRAGTELETRLTELAGAEAEFQTKALQSAVTVDIAAKTPAPAMLAAIVTERPMQGELLRSFVRGASAGTIKRIEGAIRTGMAEGQGLDAIVRRIRGTKAANYRDGVFEVSRRNARTMVRTAVNHVANQAAQSTWKANENIIKGWQFVATLDSRTTIQCASNDGKVFPIGQGPVPPLHPGCRSITTAVTKSFSELGLDRADFSVEKRASMDGQVVAPIRFERWLRNQSPERQEAVLGATRARLWRDGKLSLDDFVRNNREVITLDELRRLHPDAMATPAPAPARAARAASPPRTPKQLVDIAKTDAAERNYVLDNGRRTGTEHLVAYDSRDGTVYQRSEGGRDYVNFSPELDAAISDPGNAIILHHNHPSSSSLSLPDMNVLTRNKGARAIWAHGHNGSSFYAERGELKLKTGSIDAIAESLRKAMQARINERALDPRDASLMHQHLLWLAVNDIGQIVYRAELAGESLAAFERNRPFFESLLESLK